MTRELDRGHALLLATLLGGCARAPAIEPRPPDPSELPSTVLTAMPIADDDVGAGSAPRARQIDLDDEQRGGRWAVARPELVCPSGSKLVRPRHDQDDPGPACVLTRVQCPHNARLEETVNGPACFGQVVCPRGSEWTGYGCEPATNPSVDAAPDAPAASLPSSYGIGSAGCDLQINSIPASDVFIDGNKVGRTPIAKVRATAGRRTVRFVHSDRRTIEETVSCEEGKTKTVAVKFPG